MWYKILGRTVLKPSQSFASDFSLTSTRVLRKPLYSLDLNSQIKARLCLEAVENTETTQVESPQDSRLIKVAIVGVPNSGKSTLINQLVGQRICGTSSKVHTTRLKAKAVLSDGKTQIVFLDTPGLVGEIQAEKHSLEKSFLKDGITAARQADVICIIHDAANKWTCNELDERVIKLLTSLRNKRSILILNKVDIMRSKRKLLDLVRTLMAKEENNQGKGWPRFEQTFMVSALTGSGLPELKNYLLDISNPGPWLFDAGTSTDTPTEKLIEQAVRAALLENLPEEVPYRIRPQIEHYHELRDGTVNAVVLVQCPLPRTQRLVMGSKGWRIKKIAQEAEQQLQSALNTTVMLKLVVTDIKV